MAERHTEWLVCAENSHTNEVFARFLESSSYGFEDNTLTGALCEDSKRRNFYKCTYDGALFMWRSRIDLKFKIFNRRGPNGKIRDVTFLFRRDRRSPKKKKRREAMR